MDYYIEIYGKSRQYTTNNSLLLAELFYTKLLSNIKISMFESLLGIIPGKRQPF
jgi:hypothetical protein